MVRYGASVYRPGKLLSDYYLVQYAVGLIRVNSVLTLLSLNVSGPTSFFIVQISCYNACQIHNGYVFILECGICGGTTGLRSLPG